MKDKAPDLADKAAQAAQKVTASVRNARGSDGA